MRLPFHLDYKKAFDYKIKIETFLDDLDISKNELNYDYSIRILNTTMKGYIVSFNRSNVILNNQKDQDPINELILITGEIFNDLHLEISEYGKILKIKNILEIKQTWENIKLKVSSTYKGDVVKRILDPIEKNIQDQDLFMKSLEKDPFFFYFLMGIYGEYVYNKIEFIGTLSLFSKKPITVKKQNQLILKENGFDVSFNILPDIESLNNWQAELSNKKGLGLLETEIKGNYSFSNNRNIQYIYVEHEAFWNEQLFKNIKISIDLK